MVAVGDHGQRHRIVQDMGDEPDGMGRRDIGVLPALQDGDRAAGLDDAAEEPVGGPVLDQGAGDAIGLAGIGAGLVDIAQIVQRLVFGRG